MSKLNLNSIGTINTLTMPEEVIELSLSSSALSFFTDFKQTKPLVIESTYSAIDTITLMKKAHVRLKLVINKHEELLGIVSADDLIERKIVQKLSKGDKREDLSITEFMTPKDKLRVLEYNEVEKSSIKDVINVLKSSGQQHCLVVDSREKLVRGLFSVSDISRKLKVNVDVQDQPSFIKLANHLD